MTAKPVSETPLGVVQEAMSLNQSAKGFQELINKFSWVLGSAYGVPYSNKGTVARRLAVEITLAVVQEHLYPDPHLAGPK